MKLLKPAWVTHKDGQPIFSVDIHPDGSRFATGGQGEDAGKIIIWNMGPVRDEKQEKDKDVPKILCEMDNHLACVNCVRWSESGRYLASGGDDKLVMIWQISKYGVGSTVFGSDSKIIESWRPVHTLRGHSGDVLDLAWSPGDMWLATCSIDNSVIVWNAEKFPEQVAVLKGHTSLVKGVTWDPVGKYLASQSDDKSLRVWRTRDWQQEVSVTEPFKECGGTTHVLRCNWSPDGHYVVSAHAMNNSGPTAQIIERDGWKTSLDFVGHRKAVTVARFNPGIFSKKFKKDATRSQQYTCCAIGSRDRSLSIWLTVLKRPLVVTHDLFTNSILDISWAPTGTELLCCSCDGSVAYLYFQPEEIGTPLPRGDVNQLLENIYGKSVTKNPSGVTNQIIESADILKLQQQQHQKQQHQQQNGMSSPDSKHNMSLSNLSTPSKSIFKGMDVSNSPFKPTDKQIETKTADGKRRITPVFLSAQSDVGEAPVPFTNISFATSKDSSSIQVEKQDKVTHSGFLSPSGKSRESQPSKSPQDSALKPSTPSAGSSKSPTDKPATADKPEASSKNVAKSGGDNLASKEFNSVVQPLVALDTKQDKPSEASKRSTSPSERASDSTKDKEKDKGSNKLSLMMKRKRDKDDEQPRKRGRPRLTDKERNQKYITPTSTPVVPTPQQPVEREVVQRVVATADLSLPVARIEKHYRLQVQKEGSGEGSMFLEVENHIQPGGPTLHKVTCIKGGRSVWEQVLSAKVLAVAGSKHISCAACSDRSLSVFNSIGQKALPSIILSSCVSVLDVTGHHLMAITSNGSLYVWNIQKRTAIVKNEQLSSFMKAEDKVDKAFLTADGIPVVSLASSKSYSYSLDMGCWLLLADKSDHVTQCSSHRHSGPRQGSRASGILSSIQHSQDRGLQHAQRTLQSGQNIKQLTTLSHLESQVNACLCLQSAAEYKSWLQTYVRFLVQEGLEVQLREICTDLLGPMIKSRNTRWESTILGHNKRDLLKEILPYFSENLKTLQRMYTEFQEQLDCIDSVT